jgi:hypothetical protein
LALVAAPAAVAALTPEATAVAGGAGAVAAKGGALPNQLGRAGEQAVRAVADVGDKVAILVNGRVRVPDGITNTVVTEIKNVGRQSYTLQLKDSVQYARDTGRAFELWLRGGPNPTDVSAPLQNAIRAGDIVLRAIPTVTP